MKHLVLSAVALSFFALPAIAADSASYNVAGTNLDGSKYSGTATITLTSDSTCTIEWVTGGSSSSGICMKYENAFAAGYTIGKDVGLVVYEILSDGSLHGMWTIAGANGSGTEVLTPQ
jgi:hypothetical protein